MSGAIGRAPLAFATVNVADADVVPTATDPKLWPFGESHVMTAVP